jgi:predicted transporter
MDLNDNEIFKLLNETVSQMKNMNGNLSSEFYALLSLIITSLMLVIAKGVGTYLQNKYSNKRIKIETDKSEVNSENEMKIDTTQEQK